MHPGPLRNSHGPRVISLSMHCAASLLAAGPLRSFPSLFMRNTAIQGRRIIPRHADEEIKHREVEHRLAVSEPGFQPTCLSSALFCLSAAPLIRRVT